MFCPKCSQQQASDETRFCSRCGFQLGIVKAALAADESQVTSPLVAPDAPGTPARSRRQRDKTVGAFLMFLVALFVAATTGDEGPVVIMILFWVLLTLLINLGPLWRYFFGKDEAAASSAAPKSKPGLFRRASRQREQQALPPAQSVPVTNVGVRPPFNTAEVVRPPSVTEGTTNLLDKK